MVNLVDVAGARVPRTVPVQGADVEYHGVSAEGIAYLLDRFPEMRLLISGKDVNLTPDRILEAVPQAVSSIIACGCSDTPGDPDVERAARGLAIGDQMALLTAILEITLPDGVRPLVEGVERLAKLIGASDVGGKALAGN